MGCPFRRGLYIYIILTTFSRVYKFVPLISKSLSSISNLLPYIHTDSRIPLEDLALSNQIISNDESEFPRIRLHHNR